MIKNLGALSIKKNCILSLLAGFFIVFLTQASSGLVSAATCPIQPQTGKCAPGTQSTQDLENNPIVKDINLIVNILSVGVGVIVVTLIIIGGIQYSIAGDNPQALTAAKQRITNALIALFAYLFIFAFLQWLVPGGVFSS